MMISPVALRPSSDEFQKLGVRFALEVHPTEIAFDTFSARRALEAVNNHPAFGFNYDPSHLGYQGVDYVDFIYQFPERIFHVHMKDVYWSDTPKQVVYSAVMLLSAIPVDIGISVA